MSGKKRHLGGWREATVLLVKEELGANGSFTGPLTVIMLFLQHHLVRALEF